MDGSSSTPLTVKSLLRWTRWLPVPHATSSSDRVSALGARHDAHGSNFRGVVGDWLLTSTRCRLRTGDASGWPPRRSTGPATRWSWPFRPGPRSQEVTSQRRPEPHWLANTNVIDLYEVG